MNKPLEENNMTTLAELEARARALESELAGVQAAIAMLRATADGNNTPAQGREVPLTPAWDEPIPLPFLLSHARRITPPTRATFTCRRCSHTTFCAPNGGWAAAWKMLRLRR